MGMRPLGAQVGSVVAVGRVRSRENVSWATFRNIVYAWAITVPLSLAVSALCMLLLKWLIQLFPLIDSQNQGGSGNFTTAALGTAFY